MRLLTATRIRINVMLGFAYISCTWNEDAPRKGYEQPSKDVPLSFAPTLMTFWACRHQMKPLSFLSQKTAGSDHAQL